MQTLSTLSPQPGPFPKPHLQVNWSLHFLALSVLLLTPFTPRHLSFLFLLTYSYPNYLLRPSSNPSFLPLSFPWMAKMLFSAPPIWPLIMNNILSAFSFYTQLLLNQRALYISVDEWISTPNRNILSCNKTDIDWIYKKTLDGGYFYIKSVTFA